MCVQTHGNINVQTLVYKLIKMCIQTHGNINVCTNSW